MGAMYLAGIYLITAILPEGYLRYIGYLPGPKGRPIRIPRVPDPLLHEHPEERTINSPKSMAEGLEEQRRWLESVKKKAAEKD